MKKFILLFLTFILSLNLIFAFEVLDFDGNSETYFSLNNHEVYLKSLQNESPLIVMIANDATTLKSYDFTSCGVEYCYDFSLIDYLTDVGAVTSSTEFIITAGGTSKSIYFDSINPTFSLENHLVDSQNKLLKLYFSFADDYNVDSVEIFEVTSSGVQSFGLVSSNSYEFVLTSEGIVTLQFKVTDGAGNFETFDFDFEVLDLFAPVISNILLVKEDNLYTLKFSSSDSNLDRYEIVQNDLKLTGTLVGSSVTKTINLPFYSGKISLVVFDNLGNSKLKSINLDSSFDIDFEGEFSNEDEFVFESDADECHMVSIDSKSYDDFFSHKKDDFYVDLDLILDGEYKLTFVCSDSYYKETFTKDFYYDTQAPTTSVLSLISDKNGFIKLSWTESNDLISDVEYKLFRDGKKVYTGSRESYVDGKVTYSDSYEYYLEVSDNAGNEVTSNLVNGSPNKIDVVLTSSLDEDTEVSISSFSFDVFSEGESETVVKVKNLGKEVFSKDISSTIQKISLTLVQGVNEIIISTADEFDNKKVLRYFITYNKPIPILKEITPVITSTFEKPLVKDLSGDVIVNEINENSNDDSKNNQLVLGDDTSSFSWIWFLGFIVILVIFAYVFVFNGNKLKPHLDKIINKNIDKQDKKQIRRDIHNHSIHSDNVLHKHINNVRFERKSKKLEQSAAARKAKVDALKPKKKKSIFHNEKFSNLGNKKFNFNVTHNKVSDNYKSKIEPELVEIVSENEEVFKEETPIKDRDMEIRLKKRPSLFGFFRKEKIEPTQKEIADEKFLGYISKQRGSKSWDKTHLYRQSHYDTIAAKKLEDLKAIEQQRRMELHEKQLELDEQNKQLAKIAKEKSDKDEFDNNRRIARATMDDYISTKVSKRKSWFAEKFVDRDIKSRRK